MRRRLARTKPAIGVWAWTATAVAAAALLTSSMGEEGAVADTATLATAAKRLPIDREAHATVKTATFSLG